MPDPLRRRPRHAGSVVITAAVLVLGAVASQPVGAAGPGIEVAVPAYVHPGDPYLQRLLDPARVPPSVVVVNLANGDGDVSTLDATADALRARRTAGGSPVRVVGYVWTSAAGQVASRPVAEVKAAVDRWLAPRGGRVHYDGIFFDVTPSACGPAPGSDEYRDRYWDLRQHVRLRLPDAAALVINNPGVPVAACYLAPERRTADTFVTFEGPERAYRTSAPGEAGSWTGDNVRVEPGSPGAALPAVASGTFWHIVYGVERGRGAETVRLARERGAGYVTVTDDVPDNPFDLVPADLDDTVTRAGRLS